MRRILIEEEDAERSIFHALKVLAGHVRVLRALRQGSAAVLCVHDSDFWRAWSILSKSGLLADDEEPMNQ